MRRIQAARPWLVLAGGDFAYKGIMAAYWVLLARELATDDLGLLALANAIAMPAYAILDAGLTTHLIKDYSVDGGLVTHHRSRVRKRVVLALLLPLPMAGLAFLLSGSTVAAVATLLMCFAYSADFSGQVMLAPARALTRMEPDAVVRVIQSVGTVLLTAALLVAEVDSPVWIALASTVAYGFALIPTAKVWRESSGWAEFTNDDAPDSPEARLITQGTIALTSFARLDALLVQALLGSAALAAYTVAFKLVEVARLLPGAVSRVVLAHSSDEMADGYDLRDHLRTGVLLGAAGTVFLVLAGPLILGILFGEEYQELAGTTVRVLGFSTIPFAVMMSAAMYAIGSGKARVLRRVMVEGVLVLVLSMALMAEMFDLEGAAIGMLTAQVWVALRFAWYIFGPPKWNAAEIPAGSTTSR